jgi:hypothetical protein
VSSASDAVGLPPVEGLADLLHPLPVEEFLARDWGRTVRHLPGPADRFAGLMSWSTLDELLWDCNRDWTWWGAPNERRLERLVLSGLGHRTDPAEVTTPAPAPGLRGPQSPLDQDALTAALVGGASLNFRNIDDLHVPAADLAATVERTVGDVTRVNTIASLGDRAAYNPHRDPLDNFVLQVQGRKHWTVYEDDGMLPLLESPVFGETPRASVEFEGILEPGDVLYVPVGRLHYVRGVGEPSLHLSVVTYQRTGLDLCRWILQDVVPDVEAREPLPADAVSRRARSDALRDAVLARCTDAVVDEFLRAWDAAAPERRMHLSLEWALGGGDDVPDDAEVAWAAPRAPVIDHGGTGVRITTMGRTWTTTATVADALAPLVGGHRSSLGALVHGVGDDDDADAVRTLVTSLAEVGAVQVTLPAGTGRTGDRAHVERSTTRAPCASAATRT